MLVHGVGLMGVWCSPCFCLSSSLSEWRMRRRRKGGVSLVCFIARGLRGGWRGGGGGCMGELALLPCERSSIVPGTFQWFPRGPCSSPSPPSQFLTLTLKFKAHGGCVSHFLMFHAALSLSLCLASLNTLLILQKQRRPVPPPRSPPVPHYFASLM